MCNMKLDKKTVHMLHVFLVGPLLLYVGYSLFRGQGVDQMVLYLLMALGAGVIAYHGLGLKKDMEGFAITPYTQEIEKRYNEEELKKRKFVKK